MAIQRYGQSVPSQNEGGGSAGVSHTAVKRGKKSDDKEKT